MFSDVIRPHRKKEAHICSHVDGKRFRNSIMSRNVSFSVSPHHAICVLNHELSPSCCSCAESLACKSGGGDERRGEQNVSSGETDRIPLPQAKGPSFLMNVVCQDAERRE